MSRTLTVSIVFAFLSVGLGLALLWTVMSLNTQSDKANVLETEILTAQAENLDLTEQIDTLNITLMDKTQELEEAATDITRLTMQISELETGETTLIKEKTAVENEIKVLTSRVDESLSQMEGLMGEIAGVRATNAQLEGSLAERDKALASAEGRFSTQSTDLAQSRDREIELQTQLDASQLEVKSLQGQLREKEGERTGLQSQVEILNQASESIRGSYGITEDGIFFLDIPLPDFFPVYDRLFFFSEDVDALCSVRNPNVRITGTATVPEVDAISWSHRGDRLQVHSEACTTQADTFVIWIAPSTESELRFVYWL